MQNVVYVLENARNPLDYINIGIKEGTPFSKMPEAAFSNDLLC